MNENISNLLQKRSVVSGLVGAVAFTAGATAGYILGKRNAVTIVPAEPPSVPEQLAINFGTNEVLLIGEGDTLIPKYTTVKDLSAIITPVVVEDGEHEHPVDTFERTFLSGDDTSVSEAEPAVVNIFAIDDPDWDYDLELNNRDNETPYILHKDEFFNEEMGFRQTTVTYYAGDDIMADEQETPVYNYTQLMGPLKWGHGSGDPNVVYIRNEKLRHEWEVILHTGRFEVEVLGNEYVKELAEDELRHSTHRRFRDV